MAWFYVICAGFFEIIWLFMVKWAETNFSKFWGPPLVTIVLATPVSFLLAAALRHLPTGTVYAAYIGIGAVGAALVGIVCFGESTALPRLISLGLVVIGLAGLKILGTSAP